MPLLTNDNIQQFTAIGSGFSYSGRRPDNVGASTLTLVDIEIDTSSSVASFASELEACLMTVVESCAAAPNVDNLMLRVGQFSSNVREFHGFEKLRDCPKSRYAGSINTVGTTKLYDASYGALEALGDYGKNLDDKDYTANAILFVVTDGVDVGSTMTPKSVRQSLNKIRNDEKLESILTILVGVNIVDPNVARALAEFKDHAGFDEFIAIGDSSTKSFARLAKWMSKSISAQSQSINTGGPSKVLAF